MLALRSSLNHIPIEHWGPINNTSHLRPIYLRPKCSQQFPLHKKNSKKKREVSTMSAESHFPMAVFDYLYKCECPQFPSFSIAKCVCLPGVCMYTDRVHLLVKIGNHGPAPVDHQHPWLHHTKTFHWLTRPDPWPHQSMEWPVSRDSQKLCVYNGGLPSVQDVAYSPTPFWFVVVATFP